MLLSPDFANFFETAPPCLLLKPDVPKFTILMANKAYMNATGTSETELVGHGFLEAFPENPGDRVTGNVALLRNTLIECAESKRQTVLPGQRYDIPVRGTDKFETRYWQATNSPVLDEHGEVQYVVHTTLDITAAFDLARKERIAFEVAEEKRKELHALLMQAPGAVCILRGPQFVFELVNPTFQESFKDKKFIGNTVLEAMPEIKGQEILNILQYVYKTGQTFEGKEIRVKVARDDEHEPEDIYWNLIFKPRYNDEEHIDGIVFFGYEVTEQVAARKKIQESEERLNLAVENAEAGVFDTDLITGKALISLRYAQIFGYSHLPENWSIDKWYQHVLPEDFEKAVSMYGDVNRTGSVDSTVRIRRLDGAVRWVNILAKLHYNKDQELMRVIGTVTDVTEEKELQRQKDEFISTVSHELKTPVTSIKAYGQALKRSLQGSEHATNVIFLDRLNGQVKKLENLIKDLLDVTRIEGGKLTLRLEKIEMNVLLAEVVSELQIITPSHKLIITDNEFFRALIDRTRVTQVITNLITNAVKYSPQSDKVLIALKKQDKYMVCSVQDFGIGIPRKQKQYIFNRFHQVGHIHAEAGLNLGLGLYISKEIVNSAGGNIWFESEEGRGSTFYFSLPCC